MYFITRNIFNFKVSKLIFSTKLGHVTTRMWPVMTEKGSKSSKDTQKTTKINQDLWAIAIFGIFVHLKSESNKNGFIFIRFRPQRRIENTSTECDKYLRILCMHRRHWYASDYIEVWNLSSEIGARKWPVFYRKWKMADFEFEVYNRPSTFDSNCRPNFQF